MTHNRLSLNEYYDGVVKGDRIILAKAITLVESSLPADEKIARDLIDAVLPKTGNAIRIGITGVPGVGKSVFIESFGDTVTQHGKKVAVLAVDPTSQQTKGSILGDKTRMESLSKNRLAFIRPSASGDTLGGVAHKTRETMLLCEAAGFDFIIIETVGVGQSEVSVREMVDFFLLLMLAGAGDELQGMKKGIVENADAIVITKADGDNQKLATEAQAQYQHALHFQQPKTSGWIPKVMTCSAFEKRGIQEIYEMINQYQEHMITKGYLSYLRREQNIAWFTNYMNHRLIHDPKKYKAFVAMESAMQQKIMNGTTSVSSAAEQLLRAYHTEIKRHRDEESA